jgi:hypothetical protein
MCRQCGQWIDHEDWYHAADDLTVEEYIAWFEDESDERR